MRIIWLFFWNFLKIGVGFFGICTKIPLPSARHLEDRKMLNFEKISGATKQPTQFWGFWGALRPFYMGPVATTWVPLGAQVNVLSPNDYPNPSQARQKGFRKKANFEKKIQVPLNCPNKRNFGPFGGPMARLHGPSSHYVRWVILAFFVAGFLGFWLEKNAFLGGGT